MTTADYQAMKELQTKNKILTEVIEKTELEYNELLQKYALVMKENQGLKEVKQSTIRHLQDSKFRSNKLFAENIQRVIDKISNYEPSQATFAG